MNGKKKNKTQVKKPNKLGVWLGFVKVCIVCVV